MRPGAIGESAGNRAEIEFVAQTCKDPMIGWAFPITVTMQLNQQSLNACGRFLD